MAIVVKTPAAIFARRRDRPTSDKRTANPVESSVGGRRTNGMENLSVTDKTYINRSRRRYHHSVAKKLNNKRKLPAWLQSGIGGQG